MPASGRATAMRARAARRVRLRRVEVGDSTSAPLRPDPGAPGRMPTDGEGAVLVLAKVKRL
ncbi:hypothetical protein GCM10009527_052590 [Actinomadura nitritigenes]